MTGPRLIRIGIVAVVIAGAFGWSQAATLARSGETVPGVRWALGALSILFLVGAAVTERTRPDTPALQKDLLWGLGGGGLFAILSGG